MLICTATQIKEWDAYTIASEPIASIDLMERAAARCNDWLLANNGGCTAYCIICGNGNNGGDGLALARMLLKEHFTVRVYLCHVAATGAADFETNLARLAETGHIQVHHINEPDDFPQWDGNETIIEALFGAGLSRPPAGIAAALIEHINNSGCNIISIDIPGGMYADASSAGNLMVQATHTLTFQCMKPAFFVSENSIATGQVHVLDIGLHPKFTATIKAKYRLADKALVQSIYRPRQRFAHKGNFGHALLLAGSYGKIGAAVLAAKACLRSGAGLLTTFLPQCGYNIMQTVLPEAMVLTANDMEQFAGNAPTITAYNAIGIGPGIGTAAPTISFVKNLLAACTRPIVVDADALNIIALNNSLLDTIPADSILTPHPKEFDRLFGESNDGFERIEKAIQAAAKYKLIIVLKGHHSFIAMPEDYGYFNTTGNAGMATAGSGDVLSGILTGLLAQGYTPQQAAILGVYLHGLAGDIAAKALSQEAMIAGDICLYLGQAFTSIAS
jgi:ADP-dependent NAD(P)H-hydrate dehydratase / NAD(P)H-hydrate epimerase